ncbi:hypothetical protein [Parapedobacter luteus]|nr:hypothetical protein [Parapedobacter luteus]
MRYGEGARCPVKTESGRWFYLKSKRGMDTPFANGRRHMGGAILENPIPLHAIYGWLSGDDKPREPKCDFEPL